MNWYLLEEDGQLTVFDAGFPGYFGQLERVLGGRAPREVAALVLTHAHSDHTGFAERLRRLGVPVFVHEGDRELATTLKQPKREGSMLPYFRYAETWRFLGHALSNGGLRPQRVGVVTTYRDGDELDVPGRPLVVHAPGHTDGCCALHLRDRGVVVAGDVVYTRHPLTGEIGPRVGPPAFNRSTQQARESLVRLEPLDADLFVFGHGEPWRGSGRELAEQARTTPTT